MCGRIDEALKKSEEGIYIDVLVNPNSKQDNIMGFDVWRNCIKINISSPPKDGKANDALLELLSSVLDITHERIKIVKGARSKKKRLFIEDISKSDIVRKLAKRE